MSCPIVAGVIAQWLQACPTLSPEQAMEAIAATSVHHDETLSYPNNQYGYGEINAEAGLKYIQNHFCGMEPLPDDPSAQPTALYDLAGRRVAFKGVPHGIYVERLGNGKGRKKVY
jgi:hypothetical protein